jgi:hypothetical protein
MRWVRYILNAAGEPEVCPDRLTWFRWFEASSKDRTRIVAHDRDEGPDHNEILVSTVFLGRDHRFTGPGPPILWETMILGGPLDQETDRYTSRAAALRGHQRMCARLRAELEKAR